ncbi:MAG: hypothetical protein J5I53_04345, partial [Bradyrhizobiaceae bacterium]|nr:hypothetical protein [Bradyrhizobiaceae bacterium]
TGELQLASIAGAVNATVPVGYDRFLVADASGNGDQVEYAAVINQNAWSLLGYAGTTVATNYLATSDAQHLVVRQNATERLRVNATGEVGIGTTATAGYLLHVNGTAGTPNVRLTSISGVAAASVPAGFDRIMLANSTGDVSEASTSAVIGAAAWTLLGNSGTNPATNFIGTTDAQPLVFRTNNTEAGRFLSTGELQLASIAGAVNVAVPAGYDRFLIADASGNVDQVEYAAVINQNAWSLLGNAGTNAATNYLGTSDAQPLVVRTNATERLRVNATGEVGIGTTATAGYLLHVNGTAGTPNVRLTSISGVAAASVPAGFDRIMLANSTGDVSEASTSAVIGAAAWTLLGNSGTNPATNYLGTTDAQPLVVRTNATERLRVNATGEVGIGTTATAGYLLEVTGTAGTPNVRLTSVSGAAAVAIPAGFDRVILSNATGDLSQASTSAVVGTTAWTLLGNSGTNPATNYLGTSDAQPLVIRTNATEVARFNSTGEFGLGTTAAAGYRLHVAGTGGTENVRMGSLSAASADPIVAGSEGIVTADNNGDLRRRSAADMFTVLGIGRGIYTPAVSGSSFVIPTTGLDLQAGAVINVTVVGPSAPAVHAMVTATDAAGNTITVGTSATIGPTYSIHWMIINP